VQKWLGSDYNAKSRAAAFLAGCGLVTSQLAINTIDNAFSAGMDIAGLFPSYINIRRGAYIGLLLSIALCPLQLLSSASTYISVLSAYSVFLGPMCGIMISDYWIVRRRKIKLSDLYHGRKDGVFFFWHGVNWRSYLELSRTGRRPQKMCMHESLVVICIYGMMIGARRHARLLVFHVRLDG